MRTILVVDDSATMRRMVMTALRGLEATTFDQAVSGLAAIERLSLDPVDLVILDLNMPDVHGLEVLRFIRGQPRFRDLPVVILTTRGDAESETAALAGGATAYLTKPFRPDAFEPFIRTLLPPAERATP